ncbi:MAG: tyrosine-type recombinase/integrase [Lachnospiraceae bacterium]
MSDLTYYDQLNINGTLKLRTLLSELPYFVKDFFRGIEITTSIRTRISYAYDLRIFFQFLLEQNPLFSSYTMKDFKVDDLDKLSVLHIEDYVDHLKLYSSKKDDKKYITNSERGLSKKMSMLRSFYAYFFKRGLIKTNPMIMVDMPKLHDKAIIKLDVDEVAMLLDYIENCGSELSGQKLRFYEKTKLRDFAIVTLLLGTGIRVSECVGLDLNDVDFKNNNIKVTRKGGNQMYIFFGAEVFEALYDYIHLDRNLIHPLPGHENALFYSLQRKRISVRAVENLVKKYARQVTPNKPITPHKLRSTYGTNLYQETGDIYLVADVLGHHDVNTTKKHYAALGDEKRKQAAKVITLREKKKKESDL